MTNLSSDCTNQSLSIGFIGCGKIAQPMIVSLARRFESCEIVVSVRSESISRALEQQISQVSVAENQAILDRCDIIILCVLADTARQILPNLKFSARHQLISVMADISLNEIHQLTAPATFPCVTVPLPFIETGGCPLPVFPESTLLEQLFGVENTIIPQQTENAMGPHFAATAILSTVMAELDLVSEWLAGYTQDAVASERYVASLLSGYLGAISKDGAGRFKEAMDDLSTEGGLNAQLLTHNRNGGVFAHLEMGLQALGKRVAPDS